MVKKKEKKDLGLDEPIMVTIKRLSQKINWLWENSIVIIELKKLILFLLFPLSLLAIPFFWWSSIILFKWWNYSLVFMMVLPDELITNKIQMLFQLFTLSLILHFIVLWKLSKYYTKALINLLNKGGVDVIQIFYAGSKKKNN